jgi:chromate transporter
MMLKSLLDIFVAFFKASILSYGGGPASIPLIKAEVVTNFKWFSNEEFADALAIGNTLPGPIAPKMAAYIGHHVAGIAGAFVGVVATVVPTAVAIIILANLLLAFKDSPRMQGMLKVAKPIVVVLLLQAAIDIMTKNSYPNISAYIVSALAFIAVILLKVNPAVVMLGGLVAGFAMYKLF